MELLVEFIIGRLQYNIKFSKMAIIKNTPNVHLSGLILYVDSFNVKSYISGSNSFFDLSGYKNNLTIVGSTSFSNSFFELNGNTSSYFYISNFQIPTDKITCEIWCLSNISESNNGIVSYATNTSDNEFLIYNSQNVALYLSGSNFLTSSQNIADGKWKQIVRTSNRTTGVERLYINGELKFSGTLLAGRNFSSSGTLVIGQEQDSVLGGFDISQSFNGKFSTLLIYNDVLTDAQILKNFTSLKNRYDV